MIDFNILQNTEVKLTYWPIVAGFTHGLILSGPLDLLGLSILYSGLFLKQKFLQEKQNLNFEELKFRRLTNFEEFSTTIIYNYGFINSYACSNYARSLLGSGQHSFIGSLNSS